MSDNFLNEKPPYTSADLSTLASQYGVTRKHNDIGYFAETGGTISVGGVTYSIYGYFKLTLSTQVVNGELVTTTSEKRVSYGCSNFVRIYSGTDDSGNNYLSIYNSINSTDTYYVKRYVGDTTGAAPIFFGRVAYEDFILVDSKYVAITKEQLSLGAFEYSSIETQGNPLRTSFEPFEPLDLEGISLTVRKTWNSFDSASIICAYEAVTTYSTWEEIVEASGGKVSIPSDGYFDEPGEHTITAQFGDSIATWNLTCNDWKSDEYYIDHSLEAAGDYRIYPELDLPSEFFSDYSLYRRKTSNYNDLSTSEVIQTSLELSRMTPQMMSVGVLTYDFDYDITDLTETDMTIVHYSVTNNLVLGENTIDFSNFVITKEPSKKDYFVNLSLSDQPKYDYDNPTFDFSDIEATINEETWLNGVLVGTEVKQLRFEDLSITHQRITAGGYCTCTATYTVNNGGTTSTYRANFRINITLLRHILETEGTVDTATYFAEYSSNYFHYPQGIFKALKYNDSSIEEKTFGSNSFNWNSFYFYTDEAHTVGTLVQGENIISNNITKIYYVLKEDSSISGSYDIQYVIDAITSLKLVNSVDFVLGNELTKSQFQIEAKFESSKTESNFVNYSFCDAEGNAFSGLILSEQDIYIKDNLTTNKVFKIAKEDITWHNPAISKVEISYNGTALSYNNKIDTVDLRKITAVVSYADSAYTQTIEFQTNSVLTDDKHYYLSTNDSYFKTYDFGNPTSITYVMPTGNASIYVPISLNLLNRFSEEAYSEEITLNIIDIIDITGMTIENITNEYSIGDSFLNDNDETRVRLFYNDLDGTRKSMVINLKDGNAALNIYPPKGTVFNYSDRSVDVTVSSATNYNIQAKYNISVSTKYNYTNTKTHVLKAVLVNGNVLDPNGNSIATNYSEEKGGVYMLVDRTSNDEKYYGYLDDLFDESKSAKMILFEDYIPPIEGDSNITALYPCYVADNADKINRCHFGILFGSNNATNRLFVSGNPDIPNADWHSSAINNTNVEGERMKDSGNFSFISDLSVMYYGETDNKITGYDIVSNDKLLVLKTKSDKEKTVYFRTPALVTALDASGATVTDVNNQTLYQEEFSLVKGNNATAGVNPRAITNFNGDTIFLDAESHLVGLDLVGIIGDSQRYANSRSAYIDNRIKEYDLSESFLWTNNKYLFFPIKDYGMFVTHYETLSNGQYEWWYLTDKNPTAFLDYNNEVYFGNDEGKFYRVQKNSFVDNDKLYIDEKNSILAGINPAENEVVVSYDIIKQLDLDKSYKFKVSTSDDLTKALYSYLGLASNSGTPDFKIRKVASLDEFVLELLNEEKAYSIGLDRDIYLDFAPNYNQIIQSKKIYATYTPYRLQQVEVDDIHNDCFRIVKQDLDGNWVATDLSKLSEAVICYKLDGNYSIVNIDKEESTFQLSDGDEIVDIERYADQNQSAEYSGEIIHESNVEAFYITAPFTMGSLQSFKTIWSYTLTNDTDLPSELELSYASNKLPSKNTKTIADYTLVSKDAFGVDFDTLDFRKIDFDKTVVPRTYTMQRILPLQKFICFCFKNTNNTNSVLSTLNLTYTIPYPSYGKD